jgi:integrase
MRGHARKRGKTWSFKIDIGRDPATGKRRTKWVSGFQTQKEAQQAMRKALGHLDVGDDPIPERVTAAELAERWFAHMAAQDKPRPRVRAGYERLMRAYVLPMIGGLEVRKIRPAHAQAVLDAYNDGRSPRTVAQLRAAMSSMFNTALRWDLIATNPVRATQTPTPQKPELTTPTPVQLRELIDAAVGTPWEIPVLLAGVTGVRRSEGLALRWPNVDLETGRVRIVETLQRINGQLVFTPPKTAHAVREIPLPAFAVARLRAHKAAQAQRRLQLGTGWHDEDLVCERGDGAPCDPDSFSHGFSRIAKTAGLEDVRLHDCRHAFATAMAKAGNPAFVTAAMLGHASPAFTASVYQHADVGMLEAAARSVEEAFES